MGDDIFRDSLLRYAGYANEVGEAFRPIYPKYVVPSYVAAFTYVGADAVHKSYLSQSRGDSVSQTARIGFDVLLWQTLASVLIPGKVIHSVTAAATHICNSQSAQKLLSQSARKWAPTAIGLFAIPLIIHPIDHAVDALMDNTTRRWLNSNEKDSNDKKIV